MRRTTGLALILIALATAATPAFARHYRHHHHYYHGWYSGDYNYGGPHYITDDYTNNSRQLVGTR